MFVFHFSIISQDGLKVQENKTKDYINLNVTGNTYLTRTGEPFFSNCIFFIPFDGESAGKSRSATCPKHNPF